MVYIPLKDNVLIITPKWSDDIQNDNRKEDLCYVSNEGICMLTIPTYGAPPFDNNKMCISFPVKNGEEDVTVKGDDYKIHTFGLIRLGPKTWRVSPRIDQGPIHAFVILCDVPEPAPWEPRMQIRTKDGFLVGDKYATRTI